MRERFWNGVELVPYGASRSSTPGIHPWVVDWETKVIRGEACFRAALQLKAGGFMPDAIVAHPGWGESLFLKDVWPQARLGMYSEFFYHRHGADVDFDPETVTVQARALVALRNVGQAVRGFEGEDFEDIHGWHIVAAKAAASDACCP